AHGSATARAGPGGAPLAGLHLTAQCLQHRLAREPGLPEDRALQRGRLQVRTLDRRGLLGMARRGLRPSDADSPFSTVPLKQLAVLEPQQAQLSPPHAAGVETDDVIAPGVAVQRRPMAEEDHLAGEGGPILEPGAEAGRRLLRPFLHA